MTEKKLYSKKNEAYLISENKSIFIKKIFSSLTAKDDEEKLLKILDGEFAPKLLFSNENSLCIEYIEGMDYVDLLMLGEAESANFLGKFLAEFIIKFIKKTSLILTDENLHHYILNKDKGIVRVDFEEYREGTLKEWATKIAAFSILYDGIKIEIIKEFLNAFLTRLNYNLFSLKNEIINEAEIILKRRNRNDFDFSLYFD